MKLNLNCLVKTKSVLFCFKKLLAKEVQELSLDEKSFEEYASKLQVMWAHKNKKYHKITNCRKKTKI